MASGATSWPASNWSKPKLKARLKCRVRSDVKSAAVQGGALGVAFGVLSTPVTLTAATLGIAAGLGHTLVTYNPDYEILKDYVNQRLRVIDKK